MKAFIPKCIYFIYLFLSIAHYPEILFRCVFINCPGFFGILLGMIKQLLAQRTYEKISVHGSDRKEWELKCREIIDVDQLQVILRPIS